MALEITDALFEEKVLKNDKPVVVDFWAPWCGPCRTLAPIISEIASEYQDKALVVKVNVDENQEYAGQFGIRSIPTVLFFKNGSIVEKHVGTANKKTFTDILDKML